MANKSFSFVLHFLSLVDLFGRYSVRRLLLDFVRAERDFDMDFRDDVTQDLGEGFLGRFLNFWEIRGCW